MRKENIMGRALSKHAKNLKEIYKRFEDKNNPERMSHEDRIIAIYSMWVTDAQGVKFKAIPVDHIKSFIDDYLK